MASPSPCNLEIAIRKFIPKELIPETWQCDVRKQDDSMKDLLNKANGQLGMFASVEELYGHVATYIDFPKSYEYLKMYSYDIVDSSPTIRDTMAKKWCLYKCDLHKIFYYYKLSPLRRVATNKADAILKNIWTKLRDGCHHEMILCKERPKQPTSANPNLRAFGTTSSESEYTDFKVKWKEHTEKTIFALSDFILDSMDLYLESQPSPDYQEAADIISWVGYIMEEVAKFCQDKQIYIQQLNPTQETRKPKQVIRLFSNDSGAFVMAHDFLEILQEYGVDSDQLEKLVPERQEGQTLSYQDVLRALHTIGNKELTSLEFAKMTSPFLMFARSPIPTCNGGYCIFAMDVLYELLMNMIQAKKVFYEEKDWIRIAEFFESIKSHFDIKGDIHFIDSKESEAIMKEWEEFYNTHLKRKGPSQANAKTIQLKKDKFDLNILIRTLKSLKLDKCFEDIEKYAPLIFAKQEKKSLSDLHAAVTQCQMNCLARKIPWILEFIEKQKLRLRMDIVDIPREFDVDKVAAELEQMGTSKKKGGAKGNVATKKNTKKDKKK